MLRAKFLNTLGNPCVVSTFMRSGTHLMIDLIRRQFPAFRSWKFPLEKNDCLYLAVDVMIPGFAGNPWGDLRARKILRRPKRPLLKTHFLRPDLSNLERAQPHLTRWIRENSTFFYVIRNPLHAIPSVAAFRRSAGRRTGVPREIDRWVSHVEQWSEKEYVHTIRFEDILQAPHETIAQISAILGEESSGRTPLLPAKLGSRIDSRINRILSVNPESTEILSAKPVKPDPEFWNPELLQILEAKAGPLMKKFHYGITIP